MAKRLVNALDQMSDAFYMLDHDWRFIFVNQQAESLLQRSSSALLGQDFFEAFPQALDTRFESEFRTAVARCQTAMFEEWYAPLGIWMQVRLFPTTEGLSVYVIDQSAARQAGDIARHLAERFEVIARTTADVIWDWNPIENRTVWNASVENVFGYNTAQFREGMPAWARLIHPDERERVVAGLLKAMHAGDEEWHDEYRFVRADGSYADVRDRGVFLRNQQGVATRVIGAMVDITAHKQAETRRAAAEARNQMQASLLDKAQDAISVTGLDARLRYWNKGAERLFGWTAQEAIGRTKAALGIAQADAFARAAAVLQEQGVWTGEVVNRRKNGTILTVESHLTLMYGQDGEPESIFAIETDITKRKQAEQEVEKLASYDPLTGLPNRRLLLDRVRQAIAMCRRDGQTGALLFLDLDNFKSLNDTLGHDKGDVLLQQVAARLTAGVARAGDTVARLGGDEFVILLEDMHGDPQVCARRAETVADKIQAGLNAPFQLGELQHHTTASIGITVFDAHTDGVEELLQHADLAMYQAKASGRDTVRFFDPQMQCVINERVQLEADLRLGLQQGQFRLFYQCQTDSDGRVTGGEALVRWEHPERGLVLPALFIGVAEETGLILQLGQWVLETACHQLLAWDADEETRHWTMAVNVSAHQFRQPGFVAQVLDVIARSGARPDRLKLELTESILVADLERTVDKMHALKARGIRLALDDFGTGYSSLAYLKSMPLDQLKIDKSFVRDLLANSSDAAIVCTILVLGRTLGIEVIAEGVETGAQRDFLLANGCLAYQGYLFGRPMPAAQFLAAARIAPSGGQ